MVEKPLQLVTAAASQNSLTILIGQIKATLAQTAKELAAAKSELSKQSGVTNKFNSETNTIAKLTTALAAQTKVSVQASLQAKITSDETVQSNLATQANLDNDTVTADLAEVSTLETSATTDIASKPPYSIAFTGSITSVSRTVVPGKKCTAIITVTNTGNEATSGSLEFALWARPTVPGTSDLSLGTVTVPAHIKPGASAKERLTFTMPDSVPAASYNLVAEIMSGAANLLVSTQSFTVS